MMMVYCMVAGGFNYLADHSSEGKFTAGFWTKAHTWKWKHERDYGIWRWWPTFDGWHLLKGRSVDCGAIALAAPFFHNGWLTGLLFAAGFRAMYSLFNTFGR